MSIRMLRERESVVVNVRRSSSALGLSVRKIGSIPADTSDFSRAVVFLRLPKNFEKLGSKKTGRDPPALTACHVRPHWWSVAQKLGFQQQATGRLDHAGGGELGRRITAIIPEERRAWLPGLKALGNDITPQHTYAIAQCLLRAGGLASPDLFVVVWWFTSKISLCGKM